MCYKWKVALSQSVTSSTPTHTDKRLLENSVFMGRGWLIRKRVFLAILSHLITIQKPGCALLINSYFSSEQSHWFTGSANCKWAGFVANLCLTQSRSSSLLKCMPCDFWHSAYLRITNNVEKHTVVQEFLNQPVTLAPDSGVLRTKIVYFISLDYCLTLQMYVCKH